MRPTSFKVARGLQRYATVRGNNEIGSVKTVVWCGIPPQNINVRVANMVCDKQRRQKQSVGALLTRKGYKKQRRATEKATASHFLKRTKGTHHQQSVVGQGPRHSTTVFALAHSTPQHQPCCKSNATTNSQPLLTANSEGLRPEIRHVLV